LGADLGLLERRSPDRRGAAGGCKVSGSAGCFFDRRLETAAPAEVPDAKALVKKATIKSLEYSNNSTRNRGMK